MEETFSQNTSFGSGGGAGTCR
ncbi:hypothetical protein GIJ05_13170 [Laceyella tengchongensis]|nr:hypothetical protein [Laceyella tengchongensis]